jgi:starch synthase
VCPSVYEPFGIINLEAMACETPVVAAAVGGIPEIVVPGETGTLVPFDAVGDASAEPRDPDGYSRALAAAVNELLAAPELRRRMGTAARARVLEHFSWRSIARETLAFYRQLVEQRT